MYDVVKNNLMTEQMKLELRKNGYFHYGFERILKVSLEFINELRDENEEGSVTIYNSSKDKRFIKLSEKLLNR